MIEVHPAAFAEVFEGDAGEHGVGGVEGGANECFVGIKEPCFGPIECMCESAEEFGIGDGFSAGRNSGEVDGEIVVAPCGDEVEVFDLAGCGEQEIGEAGGIGEKQVVDDGEQIAAFEAVSYERLIGHSGSRVAVPDEE